MSVLLSIAHSSLSPCPWPGTRVSPALLVSNHLRDLGSSSIELSREPCTFRSFPSQAVKLAPHVTLEIDPEMAVPQAPTSHMEQLSHRARSPSWTELHDICTNTFLRGGFPRRGRSRLTADYLTNPQLCFNRFNPLRLTPPLRTYSCSTSFVSVALWPPSSFSSFTSTWFVKYFEGSRTATAQARAMTPKGIDASHVMRNPYFLCQSRRAVSG